MNPLPNTARKYSIVLPLLILLATIFILTAALAQTETTQENTINVYSYRQPFLVEPLFEAFEKETGIVVNVLFAKKGLIERIALEGSSSPADLLLTTDIGQMFQATESIGRAVDSYTLARHIPQKYRDPKKVWYALTKRVRAAIVRKEDDRFDGLYYEDLGSNNLEGTICMRDAQHPYNIALVAAMIAHHKAENSIRWLEGLKQNLAKRPSGNDRAQIKGVFSGECDIAIANTYYIGKMLTNENNREQTTWARGVKIVFPQFRADNGGTHINFSGMVLARFAPHRVNAIRLMEFLSTRKIQKLYAENNFEFPIVPGVEISPLVRRWGVPQDDSLTPAQIANNRGEASLLVDETGINY